MDSSPAAEDEVSRKRLPLGRSSRRLSFERRLALWAGAAALPTLLLLALLLAAWHFSFPAAAVLLACVAIFILIAASAFISSVIRPLQTLANIVSALREEDFSFRARGAVRGDALGDLALEINALAGTLQRTRDSALDAARLLERVLSSMPSPVVALDEEGRVRLINLAAEQTFRVERRAVLGHTAADAGLVRLMAAADHELLQGDSAEPATAFGGRRWEVRRSSFRLYGLPHTLFVLNDLTSALREEEKLAWQRLIRVLGHEINNSLTPIKSIAGSLRAQLKHSTAAEAGGELEQGLAVIEERAGSLNRFLQSYRSVAQLPAPMLVATNLHGLVQPTLLLEARVPIVLLNSPEVLVEADPPQIEQVLINLLKNAADAQLGVPGAATEAIQVQWFSAGDQVVLQVIDAGGGLSNPDNLFVPFYTTKPHGSGIGLTLSRQIAAAHAGTLTLRNRDDGQGCVAELRLRRATRDPKSAEAKPN